MLFDEPTSALDPELVRDVLHVIDGLADRGMTMVIVTHEMGFLRRGSPARSRFMDDGEVVEIAPPDAFFTAPQSQPAQTYVSRRL